MDAYSTNKELHFAFFKVFVLKQFPGGQITKEVSFFKLGITRRNRKIESIFTRWLEAQMYSIHEETRGRKSLWTVHLSFWFLNYSNFLLAKNC